MSEQPTTLSDVIRLISEVLQEHYGLDPEPLIEAAGVDGSRAEVSGSRVQRAAVMRLWEIAAAATDDPSIGLVVGAKVRPTTFYALSLAFMTCDNLEASLGLLCRYFRVIVTVPLRLDLKQQGDEIALEIEYIDPRYPLPPLAFDSFIASIIGLCRHAGKAGISPREVHLAFPDNGRGDDYRALFNATILFDAEQNALVFDREELEEPLEGRSADLTGLADRVLSEYIDALSPAAVSTAVRKLLLQMLPTGNASQDEISRRMNMSRSTLQRRLQAENTNYRDLLEDTRRTLAMQYVRDNKHPLSYVAFLLGFSDQSNFSRAFRRWTGLSPKRYQEQSAAGAVRQAADA